MIAISGQMEVPAGPGATLTARVLCRQGNLYRDLWIEGLDATCVCAGPDHNL